jgi:nucleoside-diphosphate-sugar epimerase
MVADPTSNIKHAIVTGATGIVGIPLCRELVAGGVRVTAYSRSNAEDRLPLGVEHELGDITDESALTKSAAGVDVIFHAAAAVHGSAKNYAEFERINVGGTKNVIDAARKVDAKLVHVSSVNVEGFLNYDLVDPYAATKSKAEELVIDAGRNGLDVVVVRPATVFGAEEGRAGLIVDRLLSGSLKVLPAPSRQISPVWSGDLARALISAAHIGKSGSLHTIAGPTVSTGEFVKMVCESGGFRKPFISVPAWIIAIPLKAAWWGRSITRWTPPVSVESLLSGSIHDGTASAQNLNIEYTSIEQIFGSSRGQSPVPPIV